MKQVCHTVVPFNSFIERILHVTHAQFLILPNPNSIYKIHSFSYNKLFHIHMQCSKVKNMNKIIVISFLIFAASGSAFSRRISDDDHHLNLISDGLDSDDQVKTPSLIQWKLWAADTTTCKQIYGFLPCSTDAWGMLFLIVIFEILLLFGEKYVGKGSEMFFKIIGPTVFGASLFQFLGTIPQIVLVLVSALSGTTAAAEQRATLGMGLVAGSTVMLLTLVWGSCVVFGSYNFAEVNTKKDPVQLIKLPDTGFGVVTDIETSYTAQIMLISLIPFFVLLIAKIFSSSSAKRVVYLLALIVTVLLLFSYIFYQIFQPWIQNRRFELLMNKYAKDKLLKLLSRNGNPDPEKIQGLFNKIDKNGNDHVSADELRVLLLGLKIDDGDLDTERDVESIMSSFDISGDGLINKDEFIKGMTQLVDDMCDEYPGSIKKSPTGGGKSAESKAGRTSLAKSYSIKKLKQQQEEYSKSWLNYLKASFFLIFGIFLLCALSEPLITTVVNFAEAANLPSFWVSYLLIPLALNYNMAIQSVTGATQKSKKSMSLTLSSLYGAVYMNNIIGLISFLAPVYIRNLKSDVFAEIVAVLLICIIMSIFTSFRIIFRRWTSYLVLLLYPISLALVYAFTTFFGWS